MKDRSTIKPPVFAPIVLSFMFKKIKLMFKSAKTCKNNDILKIMKYFGNLEILMRVEKGVKK